MHTRFHAVLFLLLSGSILFLSSCKHRRGNGNIITEERSVGSFDRVEVNGALDVYVSQGPQHSVKIEGDENLLKYIMTEERGGELEVRTKSGVSMRPTKKMKIYVSSPRFEKLDVNGACNITGETRISSPERLEIEVSGAGNISMEADAPELKAGITGAGKMQLAGKTRDFELRISGAGKARCYDMLAENTKVELSGAASAEVFASVTLDAKVSGAGNIRYKGSAPEVKQQVSGVGNVKKAD
jgi:Putative auto-transporter adhesin, head GIN domain